MEPNLQKLRQSLLKIETMLGIKPEDREHSEQLLIDALITSPCEINPHNENIWAKAFLVFGIESDVGKIIVDEVRKSKRYTSPFTEDALILTIHSMRRHVNKRLHMLIQTKDVSNTEDLIITPPGSIYYKVANYLFDEEAYDNQVVSTILDYDIRIIRAEKSNDRIKLLKIKCHFVLEFIELLLTNLPIIRKLILNDWKTTKK